MASIGPLPIPTSVPILNPVMWAGDLPSNRPQANYETEVHSGRGPPGEGVSALPLVPSAEGAASALPGSDGHPGALTPAEVQHRTAAVQQALRGQAGAGARLDPHDPHAPFGATGKDAAGAPLVAVDGREDDPYHLAPPHGFAGEGRVVGGQQHGLAAARLAGVEEACASAGEGGAKACDSAVEGGEVREAEVLGDGSLEEAEAMLAVVRSEVGQ